MALEPEQLAELRGWLTSRPKIVQDLAIEWPPGAKVMAREGKTLMFPAPGIVGRVYSYHENGNLGILAPKQGTLTSPITGNTARHGEMLNGECRPEWLELLEHDVITSEDVREALSAGAAATVAAGQRERVQNLPVGARFLYDDREWTVTENSDDGVYAQWEGRQTISWHDPASGEGRDEPWDELVQVCW